jgi:hypothetical protein
MPIAAMSGDSSEAGTRGLLEKSAACRQPEARVGPRSRMAA